MSKVIRLTETDLTRIIKRVIEEQSNKSYNKIRSIQETNQMVKKRLLREQQENDLIGKTIYIFSDKGLTTELATVKVVAIEKSNNRARIKVDGVTLSDGKFMDKFEITCGSNVISFKENSLGYVSQKLVDYLKPIICQ